MINYQIDVQDTPMENKTFKKSNMLIGGINCSSLVENKMLALAMAKAERKEGRAIGVITPGEVRKYIFPNISRNTGSYYARRQAAADEMTDRKIIVETDERDRFSVINLVGVVEYDNGSFIVKFEPDLTDDILDLKTNYTVFNLSILMSFKNVFSYRLYELLKSRAYGNAVYGNNYYVTYDISELKLLIGVVDTAAEAVTKALKKPYPDFNKIVNEISRGNNFRDFRDFKRRVIDKAVNEINEKSDLQVSYSVVRGGYGGKATQITFKFSKKDINTYAEPDKNIPSQEEIMDMADRLVSSFETPIPLKFRDAKTLLEVANYDVDKVLDAYDLSLEQDNIENLTGWLIEAIKRNYCEK